MKQKNTIVQLGDDVLEAALQIGSVQADLECLDDQAILEQREVMVARLKAAFVVLSPYIIPHPYEQEPREPNQIIKEREIQPWQMLTSAPHQNS